MPLRAGFLSSAELRRQGNTCDRSARKLTFDRSCFVPSDREGCTWGAVCHPAHAGVMIPAGKVMATQPQPTPPPAPPTLPRAADTVPAGTEDARFIAFAKENI